MSKDLPELEVGGDITTDGGEAQSLVKGVQMTLKATALSVKEGGRIGSVKVGGKIASLGDDVITVQVEGTLESLEAGGGILAKGKKSDAVHITGGTLDLSTVNVSAADGQDLVQSS